MGAWGGGLYSSDFAMDLKAMIGAVVAYIAYLALSSVIYSFVYAPGELATMTALLLYLTNRTRSLGGEPLKTVRRLM